MKGTTRFSALTSVIFSLLLIFISACGAPAPATTPTESAQTPAQPTAAPAAPTAAPAAPTAAPAAEEPLVILQGVDATTMDPHYSGSLPAARVMNHIFDRLVTQGADGKLNPMVATEWTMDATDNTVWEFKLNEAAVWADGTPLTAEDVIFTWQRSTDPAMEIVGNTAYLLNNMKIVDMTAPDAYTLRIQTETPSITLPGFMSEYYILAKHYYENLSREDAALKPLGSGPYMLKEWVKDDHLTMVVNPNYWGTMPTIEEVIWRPVPEAATRLAELLSGGADLIDNLPPDKVAEVEAAGLRVATVATGRRIYIGLNQGENNNPALKDTLVRQALNYAVDFDAISGAILTGAAKRVGVNVNPPWNNPDIGPYAYDVEKAKALLAEAGWTDSDGNGFVEKDGEELVLTFDSPNGRYIKDFEVAQAIAQYLRDAGVNTEVQPNEWSNYVAKLDAKELADLYLLGSGSSFEGQGDISDLEGSSSSNYGKWNNDEFNTLFAELRGTLDMDKRRELLYAMQEITNEEAPYIFLYMQVAFFGASDRMGNFVPYPNERVHVYDLTLTK